ncbi:MAG: hypothetical protein BWZ01_02550 [Deltaproteobacteria bacterium ADurb.BinA179]|nr:MAG: hypothetical protein BWZ01_02550 [Deltaproteobacteria bacterium ADurb.BinA179]
MQQVIDGQCPPPSIWSHHQEVRLDFLDDPVHIGYIPQAPGSEVPVVSADIAFQRDRIPAGADFPEEKLCVVAIPEHHDPGAPAVDEPELQVHSPDGK